MTKEFALIHKEGDVEIQMSLVGELGKVQMIFQGENKVGDITIGRSNVITNYEPGKVARRVQKLIQTENKEELWKEIKEYYVEVYGQLK